MAKGATSEFDTLILDAMFNYAWHHQNPVQRDYARFVTDQVVSDLQNLASGKGAAHGKYVHLYLNGLYWGLYNVHERPDDSFAAEYYGGDKDDYDVIKHANQDVNHEYTWVEGGVAAEERFAAAARRHAAVQDSPDQCRGSTKPSTRHARRRAVHRLHDRPLLRRQRRRLVAQQLVCHARSQRRPVAIPRLGPGARLPDDRQWRRFTQFTDLTGKDDAEAPTAIHEI